MSLSNYEIHKVWINEADFEVLVLKIPKNELEDKLAYLAREKGIIPKSFYEDFIIANCVANINQLLAHIKQQMSDAESLMKIREEIVIQILKVNKLLEPSNLVLNRNHVVKLKTKSKLGDGEKLLINNKNWDMSYYDEPQEGNAKDHSELPKEMKAMEDLEFTEVKKWWKRINRYIEIKQFVVKDMKSILTQNYFHNRSSFQTFIVSLCVVNSEELFIMLDTMGIPNRVSPPILMHEVYDLCKVVNPFLTYENAQDLTDGLSDNENAYDQDSGHNQTSMVGQAKRQKRKKSLKFKDMSKKDLLRLGNIMKMSLIGQDEAVDTIVDTIQRASVGLKDPAKPIGSLLFAGKTGCGKTISAKILADELIKERKNLITIDCSEYSSDHEYSKLIGCFVPGTKVLMGGGSVKNIEDIKIGEEVITHKGRKRKVQHTHEYNQDGDMVKLTTANSNIPVITTKTHEILTIKGKKCSYINRKHIICKPPCSKKDCSFKLHEEYTPEWLPASELEVGDVLLYPRYKSTGKYPNKLDLADYIKNETRYKYDDKYIWAQKHVKVPRYIEVGEDLARLAGYYVSEGGVGASGRALNFTFHTKETDYVTEVVKLIRKLFGKEIRIKIQDRSEGHTYRMWISSKVVCNFMSELFGHNTYVKHVPDWFCEMPDNLIKAFLETAFFGDGCLTIQRRVDYSTVSPDLFYSMQLMLRKLGYITSVSLENRSKKDPNCKDRYRIYIGGNQIEKLNEEFNFNLDLADMEQTNIQRLAWIDDDYLYLQIKKIDHVNYIGKVYDLTIEDDVSYVPEIIAHNSPNGYIGFEQGGQLTNAIMENPFSVVVFDEIEKASSKVHELLLQIMDEGRLTDGRGKKVSFKDAVIIMTSNIGVKEVNAVKKTIGFGDVAELTGTKQDKAITAAIKNKFKPEFLNRIDSVINFKPLTKKDYMRIIDIELYKLNDNLRHNATEYKKCELVFDKHVRNFIFKKGIDEQYGARPLKRCIEKEIASPLAKKLLENTIIPDSKIKISMVGKKVDFGLDIKKEDDQVCNVGALTKGA